ncbi:MAG: SpoIIE family protein phosphatase [Candidatus Cloacimonetes bacterium]|nr:SpoIIE family protein phosphatase [Candidatus Cloacimonadota bacterium]
MNSRIKRPILLRLTLSILLPLCFIYTLVLLANYRQNRASAEDAASAYLQELCAHHASNLDANLRQVEQQCATLANTLGINPGLKDADLNVLLRAAIAQNPFLSGITIAFQPYAHNRETELYAPYLYREDGKVKAKELNQDYNYTVSDWYLPLLKDPQPYWTEPYHGESSGVLNASYLYPISPEGQFIAVAGADLSLPKLTGELANLRLDDAIVLLLSKEGSILSHPNQDWIMRQNLQSLASGLAPEYRALQDALSNADQGLLRSSKDNKGNAHWIAFQRVPATAWTFAVVKSEASVTKELRRNLKYQISIMLIGLALIILLILSVSISIVRPIKALQVRARKLADGDLDSSIIVPKTRDEVQELAELFNSMTTELKLQIAQQEELSAAKARVESELSIAHDIQQSLLPHVFPPFPNRPEFALYAQMIPARDVAGDFFDFFFCNQQELVLIIADVSGKGIPAALYMAVTRTLLKTAAENADGPSEALNHVNRVLAEGNDSCMFTTLFIAFYHLSTGCLRYANAGHLPPLLFCRDGQAMSLPSLGDPALGIVENYTFHEASHALKIGDRLIFFTDGVTEAQDASGNFFGTQRLGDILQGSLEDSIENVQNRIKEELIAFQKGELADDITMLFFSRRS